MNPVYIPADKIEDWKSLLADPEKHWRQNYSAMSVAEAWHHANGFPAAVATVLHGAGEPLASLKPLMIVPEHKVMLPGGQRASQNDVWVLARHPAGLASMTIEAKVGETFGPTLGEWSEGGSVGKEERLRFLTHTVGISGQIAPKIRYQLLHRTASAVIEAERFRADTAVMLVHSFSSDNVGLGDFQEFVRVFGQSCGIGQVVRLNTAAAVNLYVGWVRDAPSSSKI